MPDQHTFSVVVLGAGGGGGRKSETVSRLISEDGEQVETLNRRSHLSVSFGSLEVQGVELRLSIYEGNVDILTSGIWINLNILED